MHVLPLFSSHAVSLPGETICATRRRLAGEEVTTGQEWRRFGNIVSSALAWSTQPPVRTGSWDSVSRHCKPLASYADTRRKSSGCFSFFPPLGWMWRQRLFPLQPNTVYFMELLAKGSGLHYLVLIYKRGMLKSVTQHCVVYISAKKQIQSVPINIQDKIRLEL